MATPLLDPYDLCSPNYHAHLSSIQTHRRTLQAILSKMSHQKTTRRLYDLLSPLQSIKPGYDNGMRLVMAFAHLIETRVNELDCNNNDFILFLIIRASYWMSADPER
jgi:hypothetical protein